MVRNQEWLAITNPLWLFDYVTRFCFSGLFFADSDIGVGTIVGSAVFNILFIIGICGIGAGMVCSWSKQALFYHSFIFKHG